MKMPPKKNVTKNEETVNSSKESVKQTKKNMKTTVETSSRTLRSRKAPTLAEPVKAKSLKTTKIKNTNGVTSDKKAPSNQQKRAKLEKNSEGEPATKKNKIEDEGDHQENDEEQSNASSIYDFKAKTIQGSDISLSNYKGNTCVIVNVASKCGHTATNYKELVQLYEKYGDSKGLKILAFPCNQFGKQEPGDNEKICEFAKKRNVEFDMFEKIDVNGKNAHPLWKYLTSQIDGPKGSKIDWNFTKFIISKDGQVVERFKSSVKPLALVKELEKIW